MKRWIPDLIKALDVEIEHISRRGRRTKTFLHSGTLIRAGLASRPGVSGVTYRVNDDTELPGDTIGTLRLDSITLNASVLESQPGLLVLAVEHPSGPLVSYHTGTFERDNTQLTRRLRDVLDSADAHGFNWDLLEKLIGDQDPLTGLGPGQPQGGLSEDQARAVALATGSEVLFLQGPPGTGKTHTIGRIVQSVLSSDRSILVTSHTHVAVDQALLASIASARNPADGRLVRLGLPRLPEVPPEFAQQGTREVFSSRPTRSRAVFCTLAKRYMDPLLLKQRFDVVLIDEVSMVNAALALPALGGAAQSMILVGDPHQLPPIVQSDDRSAKRWLGRDLFDLCNATEREAFAKLVHQRRMRPRIADITRALEYSGTELIDHPTTVRTAPRLIGSLFGDVDVGAVDIPISDGYVQWTDNSAWNLHSALSSVAIAKSLLDSGYSDDPSDRPIGIITFYTKQRMLLMRLCSAAGILDRVLPGTVHTFQGNEVAVAILDPVLSAKDKSNRLRDPDVLADTSRQMNVAVSRARDQLMAVGNMADLRFLPRTSGLGKLMAEFTDKPLVNWSLSRDQDLWPTFTSLDDLNIAQAIKQAGSLLLVGPKQLANDAERTLIASWKSGRPTAFICTDDRARSMAFAREMPWIRWTDDAPEMLVSDEWLAIRDRSGWVMVEDRATTKAVTDFMRITELLTIVEARTPLRCQKCDSDLVGEQMRYSKLKGQTVLRCRSCGPKGGKGTLIVLNRSHKPAKTPQQDDAKERDFARRVGKQMADRSREIADQTNRVARDKSSGVPKCKHAMAIETCPYCNH